MKKHIKKFITFINENNQTNKSISYSTECLGYHHGQHDMETGIYENDKIIGVVQYTLYKNELTIKDIVIIPTRRREGFGSLLINQIKKENPSYIYKPSLKTNLGSLFIHKQINESISKKVFYHGSLWEFKEFKNKISYFCSNPKFCYDYASTKSLDRGLDLDVIIYKCEFNGKLFDYKNDKDMNILANILPTKINVHHGTAWFLSHEFDKEEMINRLKGIATVEPIDYIKDANIGDEVPNPQYKSELLIVVDKDDDNVYTIYKKTYDDYLETSSIGPNNFYFTPYEKYKDIFQPWREEIVNIYNKNKNTKQILSRYSNNFDLFLQTMYYNKKGYNIDYVSNSNDKVLAFTKEDIDIIENIYNECLLKFKELAFKELNRKEWNRKTIKEKMNSNWNYYENEIVANLIKKLGYDGYIALEKGHETYAIFEPNKTIKILGKV